MRIFITVLVLIFSFQSWTKADDISDFEIEGISIGDSLLDHFTLEKIINENNHTFYPSSRKFFQINFENVSNFKTYQHLTALVKLDDKNYIIYVLTGYIDYKKNINDCYRQEKKVINDIKNILSNVDLEEYGKLKKKVDKTGESTLTINQFFFTSGDLIKISCHDWSKSFEAEGEIDSISVSVTSKEAYDWFVDEAYN